MVKASAQAQNGVDSLRTRIAQVYAPLDKSQVPTGYLYEAGVRLLEPGYYNGMLSDSNLADLGAPATCPPASTTCTCCKAAGW